MNKLVTTLGSMAPVALAALFVVLLLPMAASQAPVTHATHVTQATSGADPVAQAPIIAIAGWSAPSLLQPIAAGMPVCDDAACNESCLDQYGGGLGFCRGNHCVCGI